MPQSITIIKPDDWHLHLRDGAILEHTVPASANHFARALVMPNLRPPLTCIKTIAQYRDQVIAHAKNNFTPYFSLYLTDNIPVSTLEQAKDIDHILGAKLYPAGATTNSEAGVSQIKNLFPLFEVMQDNNLVLQVHGETTCDDIFDREAKFVLTELKAIINNFPKLRVVLEHISSKTACDFVCEASDHVAATITIHHLLFNRNHLLAGGIKPHFYCLPILKTASDQNAIQEVALSGNPKFFLGTDSAPHAVEDKESACGCAGIYSAPYALALYTQFFDDNQSLSKLEGFASLYGADFYQLSNNSETITLERRPQTPPPILSLGQKTVQPIFADRLIQWSVV